MSGLDGLGWPTEETPEPMKPPTEKQVAARKRNWDLYQLKSAVFQLKRLLPQAELHKLYSMEKAAKESIDARWKNPAGTPPWQ